MEKRLEDRSILLLRIPRLTRQQRPLYLGPNPRTGTYRRDFQGDYRCTPEEVSRMFGDQLDESADSRVLEHFTLQDLDMESVKQYRQRFDARDPNHPWLSLELPMFLEKIGAWRKERTSGKEGLTVAGLLMFGMSEFIQNPEAVPQYHVDYRERLSPDPAVRWTDRITIDGTWAGNVFQFYQRMLKRLSADLKTPFQLDRELFRKDETIVHEAIREAVVNAFVHADYRGQGGIIIEKYPDRIELSNPGILLISWEQMLHGGISECRNKTLQKMFHLIGGGEKAGSGIDKIRRGWASQHWRHPSVKEWVRPDRVRLVLPMVSLIPDESLEHLERLYGHRFRQLSKPEIEALVTAELEGEVSNERLREISAKHPTELTKILQRLTANGFLTPRGQGRWTTYTLAARAGETPDVVEGGTPNIREGTQRRGKNGSAKASAGGTPNIVEGGTPIITQGTPNIREGTQRRGKSGSARASVRGTPNIAEGETPIITHRTPNIFEEGIPLVPRTKVPLPSPEDSLQSLCPRLPNWNELEAMAGEVRLNDRVSPETMRQVILNLCRGQFLTVAQLAELLNRHTTGLRQRYLQPMTNEGLLALRFPETPSRPDQAYKATGRKKKR